MIKLQDDDRDDWLSRYMDDELSPEERTAVEARIKDNALWREEFARLQASTRFVEKVLIKFQTDDGFARSVTSKLTKVDKEKVERERSDKSDKRQPAAVQTQAKPHRALPRPRRHRTENSWLPIFGAAAAVALIAGFVIWNSSKRVTPETPAAKTPPSTNQNVIVFKQDLEVVTLADGTKVAGRRGAELKKIDDRTVSLSGEALFVVAKSDRPFTVQSGDGLKIQALGTRFEVSTQQNSAQIRVAEGLVRVQKAGGKSVDARGGMLVTPNLDTRMFDPRDLDVTWKGAALTESVPFWSQSYGGAAHAGSSPLKGPEDLGNSSSAFFAYPEKIESPESGAVISAANKAYVIARSGAGNAQLLEVAFDGPNRGRWRTCNASNVSPRFSPVLTPTGLVVTAAIDGTISAYDPDTDKTVWTFKEKSMLVGLSADPREMILVSTVDEIVALDARDGKLLWQTRDVKGFSAPATVLPSGLICGVVDNVGIVVLEPAAGKVVKNVSWPRNMSRPASVSSTNSNEVWLTSGDGYVVRANVETGEKVEKYFGWQLKCAPIGSGLLGIGSYMMHFDQPAAITAPADDTIVAIAQDGRKEVFAGYQRGIMHLRSSTPAAEMLQWRGVGFTNLSKGFMVKDGLAIASGKLVATTSAGIQLFE